MSLIGQENLIREIKKMQPEQDTTKTERSVVYKKLDLTVPLLIALSLTALTLKILAEFCVESWMLK